MNRPLFRVWVSRVCRTRTYKTDPQATVRSEISSIVSNVPRWTFTFSVNNILLFLSIWLLAFDPELSVYFVTIIRLGVVNSDRYPQKLTFFFQMVIIVAIDLREKLLVFLFVLKNSSSRLVSRFILTYYYFTQYCS